MMRRVGAGVGVLSVAIGFFALGACKRAQNVTPARDASARPPSDAGSDADASDFDAAGPLARNELRVKRYEDEVPTSPAAALVVASPAPVLTAFPKGDEVARLRAGHAATRIAERNGFYLVTFADPTEASRTLLGWIARFAFEPLDAGASAGTKLVDAPWCSGQKVLALQPGAKPRCGYVCYRDFECTDGATCEAAADLPKLGKVPTEFEYTTVCTPPPGAAPSKPRDAGGVPSLVGAPFNPDGRCPKGFAAARQLGAICFMTCQSKVNCPEDMTCHPAPGTTQKFCFGE